ncbi:MAG: PQQ-binding-like beta-propeller repeat protein [Planctomyces sp.]|nr:PQQ-binding-like beta-propeller repeat protein [Planctomyces sp.]
MPSHMPAAAILTNTLYMCLLLLPFQPACAGDDWPQFRGPNCRGVANADSKLPVHFSSTENVRWKVTPGDGIGGACVAEGRVFVSGMKDAGTVQLMALDLLSGNLLWQREWAVEDLAEIHETNSHASSTPAADKQHVYFYFTKLGLLALDAATGKDAWQFPIPEPFFVFKWGAGVSPVLYNDLVLFCQDDDLNPALYAIRKSDGQLAWKDNRIDMAVNYSHPVINTVNGVDEIVVAGTGMVIGYDPASGRRNWFARGLLRNIKTTPVSVDGTIYISLQSSGIANQWLVAIDQADTGNHDGRIDEQETQAYFGSRPIPPQFFERTFKRGDSNNDGFLEGAELDAAFLHPDNFAGASFQNLGEKAADEYILAVRGGGHGDVSDSHVLWRHSTKHTDHVVSPIVTNEQLLLLKSGGICTVFDLKGGQMQGGPKRVGNAANFFASPVSGGGHLYFAGENGTVTVLKDTPSLNQLAINDLGESIVATPAIAGNAILFRTRGTLYCISD